MSSFFSFETDADTNFAFRSFPELEAVPKAFKLKKSADKAEGYLDSDAFAIYEGTEKYLNSGKVSFDKEKDAEGRALYNVSVSDMPAGANEVYMHIDYAGDTAALYSKGEILTDSFYTGQEWEIGRKRYENNSFKGEIFINPLCEEDKKKMYLQSWPDMEGGKVCKLNSIRLSTQYGIEIS